MTGQRDNRRLPDDDEAGCVFCGGAVPIAEGSLELGVAPWLGERSSTVFEPQFTLWAHHACFVRASSLPADLLEVQWTP